MSTDGLMSMITQNKINGVYLSKENYKDIH